MIYISKCFVCILIHLFAYVTLWNCKVFSSHVEGLKCMQTDRQVCAEQDSVYLYIKIQIVSQDS